MAFSMERTPTMRHGEKTHSALNGERNKWRRWQSGDFSELSAHLEEFIDTYYNRQRLHSALGYAGGI
jgi:transposase InsO family protein